MKTSHLLLLSAVLSGALVVPSCAQQNPQQRPNANHVAPNQDNDARVNVAVAEREATTFPMEVPPLQLRAASFAVPAGAIWVSPDGRAQNDGKNAGAPTTLRRALNLAQDGDMLVLKGGTYRDGEFAISKRLTLQNAPGEIPLIKGSDVVSNWTKDGDFWRASWDKKFAPYGYLLTMQKKVQVPAYPMVLHGDQVFLDGKPVFQVSAKEKLGAGRFWLDDANKTLWIGDDPTGKVAESTARKFGIRFSRAGDSNAGGSTMRGLHLMHFASTGGAAAAPRVTIENCTFAFNGERGFNFHPFDGNTQGMAPHNGVFRGNEVIGNGLVGVSGGSFNDLLFERNRVAYNNLEGFRFSWSASGVKFVYNKNLVARDNLIENNNSMGLWLDVDVDHAQVYRNVARNNRIIGIFYEVSGDALIAHNWCENNNSGIQTSNSVNAKIWNNTLVDNKENVRFQWWRRVNQEKGESAGVAPKAIYESRGHELWNNLFVVTRANRSVLVQADAAPDTSVKHLSASGHNLYLRVGEAAAVPLALWKTTEPKLSPIADLPALRALMPNLEANSRELAGEPPARNGFRFSLANTLVEPVALPENVAKMLDVNAQNPGIGAQNADFSRVPQAPSIATTWR